MAFCNVCKNNITTSAIRTNLDLHKKHNLLNQLSEPTDKIVLMVYHEHPESVQFDPKCILQWWNVLGKLILKVSLNKKSTVF
jgi:hypothetical protein